MSKETLFRARNASPAGIDIGSSCFRMPEEKIIVTAYCGSRSEELPRSFVLRSERIEVAQILDMWIGEGSEAGSRKRFFKVRGSDGFVHKIFYDETALEWFIVL